MFLYIALIIGSVILIMHRQFKWHQHVKKYKDFYKTPGPLYLPILGSTHLMFRKNILDIVKMFRDVYGKSFIIYVTHRTYVTSDPEEIKIILNQALDKSKEYNHLQEVFDTSLLLCKAPIWKQNRKLISKSFNQNILEMFLPTFYEKSQVLVEILSKKKYTDVSYCFEKYTLDVFCEATLGIKSSILKTKESSFVDGVTKGQKLMFGRIGNLIKMNNFLFSFLPDAKQINKIVSALNNFLQNIIKEKQACLNSGGGEMFTSRGLPVLDLLLQVAENKKLTEDYICNEMVLFASAATDTTAYSLTYCFCLMAMHPEVQEGLPMGSPLSPLIAEIFRAEFEKQVMGNRDNANNIKYWGRYVDDMLCIWTGTKRQEKVFKEITSVVGKDEEIDINHLNQLKYTEMALNESMRLLPTVPMIGRQVTCDMDIGTKVIPKDTGIIVNFMGLHRDKNIYPDPTVYDPDRFLPEYVKKRHPYSFLPFSGGPRNCIGWKYAQMLMKTTIANVVKNFKIETKYKSINEIKLVSSVVMMPSKPIEMSFIPRNEK